MKSYQFTCCRRDENNQLTILPDRTPIVTANTRGEALEMLKDYFTENQCLPYREVT
jgi:hypothetical protein